DFPSTFRVHFQPSQIVIAIWRLKDNDGFIRLFATYKVVLMTNLVKIMFDMLKSTLSKEKCNGYANTRSGGDCEMGLCQITNHVFSFGKDPKGLA
ncbi:hypothetical protein M8C21_019455, partial [Ambrosia artemisiifolia]